MSNNPKNNLIVVIFFLFTIVFWSLRIKNFDQNMNFGPDQAHHIREVYDMVQNRDLRLIGPIDGTRIVNGKGYFIGPQYYYLLSVLGVIFDWNVVYITYFTIFCWWLSVLILFYWIGKKLDWISSLLIYGVISTFFYFVSFSKMFINPNFVPLLSIPFTYFTWKAISKRKHLYWFASGFFAGLVLSFHFSNLIWLVVIPIIWLVGFIKKHFSLMSIIFFSIGLITGDLPYVVFELRNNFYNLRTIISNGLNPHSLTWLTAYYYFSFLPAIGWLLAIIFSRLTKHLKYRLVLLMVLLVFVVTYSVNFYLPERGFGMEPGWTIKKQRHVAEEICKEPQKEKFNVANLVGGGVPGYDLRWWVNYLCSIDPLGYDQYPFTEVLFMVDHGDIAEIGHVPTWEIASMEPFRVDYQKQLGDDIYFYKISRIK